MCRASRRNDDVTFYAPPLSSELLLQLAVDAFVPALSDVEFGEYVLEGKQSWAGFV